MNQYLLHGSFLHRLQLILQRFQPVLLRLDIVLHAHTNVCQRSAVGVANPVLHLLDSVLEVHFQLTP